LVGSCIALPSLKSELPDLRDQLRTKRDSYKESN
jgi:hypothetical protein